VLYILSFFVLGFTFFAACVIVGTFPSPFSEGWLHPSVFHNSYACVWCCTHEHSCGFTWNVGKCL